MLIYSNHIGHQCAKPTCKLEPTLHPTASVLKLCTSPLAPVYRGVLPAYKTSIGRSAQMDVSSAAAASSQTVITECDATNSIRPETTQEMVNLAVVWACQHGLVGDPMFQYMSYYATRWMTT